MASEGLKRALGALWSAAIQAGPSGKSSVFPLLSYARQHCIPLTKHQLANSLSLFRESQAESDLCVIKAIYEINPSSMRVVKSCIDILRNRKDFVATDLVSKCLNSYPLSSPEVYLSAVRYFLRASQPVDDHVRVKRGREWLRGDLEGIVSDADMALAKHWYFEFYRNWCGRLINPDYNHSKSLYRRRVRGVLIDMQLALARAHLARLEHEEANRLLTNEIKLLERELNVANHGCKDIKTIRRRSARVYEYFRLHLILSWRSTQYFQNLPQILSLMESLPKNLLPGQEWGNILKECIDACTDRGIRPPSPKFFQYKNTHDCELLNMFRVDCDTWQRAMDFEQARMVMLSVRRIASKDESTLRMVMIYCCRLSAKKGDVDTVKNWWYSYHRMTWARPSLWAARLRSYRHREDYEPAKTIWLDVYKELLEIGEYYQHLLQTNNRVSPNVLRPWEEVWMEGVAMFAGALEPEQAESVYLEYENWLKRALSKYKPEYMKMRTDGYFGKARFQVLMAYRLVYDEIGFMKWYNSSTPDWMNYFGNSSSRLAKVISDVQIDNSKQFGLNFCFQLSDASNICDNDHMNAMAIARQRSSDKFNQLWKRAFHMILPRQEDFSVEQRCFWMLVQHTPLSKFVWFAYIQSIFASRNWDGLVMLLSYESLPSSKPIVTRLLSALYLGDQEPRMMRCLRKLSETLPDQVIPSLEEIAIDAENLDYQQRQRLKQNAT